MRMELVLETTQQGSSHEISVSTEGVEECVKKKPPSLRQKLGQFYVPESLRMIADIEERGVCSCSITKTKCPIEYRAKRSQLISYIKMEMEWKFHVAEKSKCQSFRNSDVMYSSHGAQDGKSIKDVEDYVWAMISRKQITVKRQGGDSLGGD
ncbi:hypothetical protein Tco_0488394 [Tanacetum coccineum]